MPSSPTKRPTSHVKPSSSPTKRPTLPAKPSISSALPSSRRHLRSNSKALEIDDQPQEAPLEHVPLEKESEQGLEGNFEQEYEMLSVQSLEDRLQHLVRKVDDHSQKQEEESQIIRQELAALKKDLGLLPSQTVPAATQAMKKPKARKIDAYDGTAEKLAPFIAQVTRRFTTQPLTQWSDHAKIRVLLTNQKPGTVAESWALPYLEGEKKEDLQTYDTLLAAFKARFEGPVGGQLPIRGGVSSAPS